MPGPLERKIVLVTRRTRLEELIAKYHTRAQAQFYLEHLGADFADYVREHDTYAGSQQIVLDALSRYGRYHRIDRAFLTNYLFAPEDIVVALGQDGLVANTMKYLDGQPLVGINPDPLRYDGVLVPFDARDFPHLLSDIVADKRPIGSVAMAQAELGNGERMYGVNDLFIGPRSHTSARYELRLGDKTETQSSSGIIVSTGLGSTGWMRSVQTGAAGVVSAQQDGVVTSIWRPISKDARMLQFAVREPFPSRHSNTSIIFGALREHETLELRSLMAEGGVIFSDGMESDHLDFNAGAVANIQLSSRVGCLVS